MRGSIIFFSKGEGGSRDNFAFQGVQGLFFSEILLCKFNKFDFNFILPRPTGKLFTVKLIFQMKMTCPKGEIIFYKKDKEENHLGC